MKRDMTMSLILHLVLITIAFVSAPFSLSKQPFDYGEVIKIKAVTFPDFEEAPAAIEPVSIPQPVDDGAIDIPIDDPTSIDEPKPIDKPKEKPKEEKPKDKPRTDKPRKPTADSKTDANGEKEIDTKATGTGSPFAGATIDNASFNYPYWFTLAFNKIASNFRRTVAIDGTVICVVHFQVIKSGRVIDLEIVQSSGFDAVDRDCLAAIERSKPFPPLPKEFRDEIIGITLPIRY